MKNTNSCEVDNVRYRGKLDVQDSATSYIPALHFMFQIRFKLALLGLTLAFLNKNCQSL